ncbi:hypothetical protein [Burkholderia anthina]|nr:hypothetical protein [Burkholderia anthina]
MLGMSAASRRASDNKKIGVGLGQALKRQLGSTAVRPWDPGKR